MKIATYKDAVKRAQADRILARLGFEIDWYKNAVAAAASYPSPPTRCDNPECEFHLGRE